MGIVPPLRGGGRPARTGAIYDLLLLVQCTKILPRCYAVTSPESKHAGMYAGFRRRHSFVSVSCKGGTLKIISATPSVETVRMVTWFLTVTANQSQKFDWL